MNHIESVQEAAERKAREHSDRPRSRMTWASFAFYAFAAAGIYMFTAAEHSDLEPVLQGALRLPLLMTVWLASIRLYGKR